MIIIQTIKNTVNLKIQSCFGCFNQLFSNLSLNHLFLIHKLPGGSVQCGGAHGGCSFHEGCSIQGFSAPGVMGSQKPALISGPDCPCLNDYKFQYQLPQRQRSQQEELSTLEPRFFFSSAAQLVGNSSWIGGN